MTNGVELWRGPSRLDGSPIVIIATGLKTPSRNPKTGPMIQVWILRQDIEPHVAVKQGQDEAVCGTCPLKSGNGCYVLTWSAPLRIYRTWLNGGYPKATSDHWERMAGEPIRLGAYGDPVAAPLGVTHALHTVASVTTGYTHQWRRPDAQDFRPYLMASTETDEGLAQARKMGWRAFHISRELPPDAIWCPATQEGGSRAICATCQLCRGAHPTARDIAVYPHGARQGRIQ